MKYLEEPQLEFISNILTNYQIGERVLNGRLEAFSCKRAGDDKKLSKMLEQKYQDELATSPQHYSSSPMGPLTDSASRRLLIDLISTMNASFPDYDFSSLTPDEFVRQDVNMVLHQVNSHLGELTEAYNMQFLQMLWDAIDKVVNLRQCEVYSYVPDLEEDPFSEGALWSFNFFFFNKELKRIVYFTCVSTSTYQRADPYALLGNDEDDDIDDDELYHDEFGADDERSGDEVDMFTQDWEDV